MPRSCLVHPMLALSFVTSLAFFTSPASAAFTCPSEGIFGDPEDCSKFYGCSAALEAVSFPCSSGTFFNSISLACDYEWNMDCGDRPCTDCIQANIVYHTRLPDKVLGLFLPLADDTFASYTTTSNWSPKLHPYQQNISNVLFFTFINPTTMQVPIAFRNLAATRGTGSDGAVPDTTKILFTIGGAAYSKNASSWSFLASQAEAEAMAEEVAKWPSLYKCDGINIDIEDDAASAPDAGTNLNHFIVKLRQAASSIIILLSVNGYPHEEGEIAVVNEAFNVDGSSNNHVDSLGLLVYKGTTALNYVNNYAYATLLAPGFPIDITVPKQGLLLGCKGSNSQHDIDTLANEVFKRDFGGILVWFASVKNGPQYDTTWDLSEYKLLQSAFSEAKKTMEGS